MSRADLSTYQAEWVEPVTTNYHGYDIYERPPNRDSGDQSRAWGDGSSRRAIGLLLAVSRRDLHAHDGDLHSYDGVFGRNRG